MAQKSEVLPKIASIERLNAEVSPHSTHKLGKGFQEGFSITFLKGIQRVASASANTCGRH